MENERTGRSLRDRIRAIRNPDSELGFGESAQQGDQRMVNPDGSPNVEKLGLSKLEAINVFHSLITMKWSHFMVLVLTGYVLVNLLFTTLYYLIGIEQLGIPSSGGFFSDFMDAFFFSTQSFTTVGYGRVNPQGLEANAVASVESLIGLLSLALATGLLYARFSRPEVKLMYSDKMVIAPYRGGRALMYRFGNGRRNQLLECELVINAAMDMDEEGRRVRRFKRLELEFSKITIFPLSWTVVHPINEESPIWGFDEQKMQERNVEFIIMFKATDETYSQTVYDRHSYTHRDILWGQKFRSAIGRTQDGRVSVDFRLIGVTDPAELPPADAVPTN